MLIYLTVRGGQMDSEMDKGESELVGKGFDKGFFCRPVTSITKKTIRQVREEAKVLKQHLF